MVETTAAPQAGPDGRTAPDGRTDENPAPTKQPDAPGRPRLAALDGLRFAAAMGVLAYHYIAVNHDAWGGPTAEAFPNAQPLAVFGSFGVQLFFVISGFVILLSAWGRDVRSFAASRVGRLFPAYWLSVALVLLLLLVVAPGYKHVGLPEAAANLTMTQRAFGVQDLESVYWTLWAELRFYVLIGVLLVVGMTRNRLIAFAAVWPVLAAISVQAKDSLWSTVLVGTDAPLFAGGMVLFLLLKDKRSPVLWAVLGLNVALAGVVSGHSQSLRIETSTDLVVGTGTYWAAIVVCFALVALAVLSPLSRLSWRWLTLAGALTYPLYLLHSSWGQWLISKTHPHLPTAVTFLLVTLVMLAAAYLVHRFVERPLGPRLRRAVASDLGRVRSAVTGRSRTSRAVTATQLPEPKPWLSR